jgi:hypothetical protein
MTAICGRALASDIRASLLRAVYCSWQGEWAEVVNNKLCVVKHSVRAWKSSCCHTRRDEVILTRLRIGYTRITHGFLLRGEDAPVCAHCDSPISAVHILSNCPFTGRPTTNPEYAAQTTEQKSFRPLVAACSLVESADLTSGPWVECLPFVTKQEQPESSVRMICLTSLWLRWRG